MSLEWRPYTLEAARRKIRGAQRHYFSKRYSMMAHVQETEGTASAMVDSAADADPGRLGGALVELEADGIAYGDIGLTVALHGELGRIEALDAEIRRIFGGCDAKVIREGYGQLAAWFSRMPAQPRRRQIRHVFASAGVAACLAPLSDPRRGRPRAGTSGDPPSPSWRHRGGPPTTTTSSAATWATPSSWAPPAPGRASSSTSSSCRRSSTTRASWCSTWGLLPLAHAVPRWRLPRALARDRGRHRDCPQTLLVARDRAYPWVPHGLGDPAPPPRGIHPGGRRCDRAPGAGRGHLHPPARGSSPFGVRGLAAAANVARDEPVARRRNVGPVLRQRRRRRAQVRGLAGDRPGRGGRARGPL